jgi:molybdenum cofactor cytidylyltransferase
MQNIGAVVLAAGESSRFGRPKQLIQFRGKSLVRRIVEAASEAGCKPIVAVIGGDAEGEGSSIYGILAKSIARELKNLAVIAENKDWRLGLGTSVRVGVRSLTANAPNLEAIILLVCDQPFVDARTINGLIERRQEAKKPIVASAYSGTLGVPALFGRSLFGELLALDNESGAKSIILSNRKRVAEFPFSKGKIDIDSVADLERLDSES